MIGSITPEEESQLLQTIDMFEVITQSQPTDYQSLEILKEAYAKLGRDKEAVGTAKRIADAYLQLGQLSSAILELETILQRYPNDPEVQKKLQEIESRTTQKPVDKGFETPQQPADNKPMPAGKMLDDGRDTFIKMFVTPQIISQGDFDACWPKIDPNVAPSKAIDPFLQNLADRNVAPLDKTLKTLCDKSRLAYLPLERYDIDVELARSFPKESCRRWCVLPFDKMSKSVFVATCNPFNQQAMKELSAATKLRLTWYITSPADLIKLIAKVYR